MMPVVAEEKYFEVDSLSNLSDVITWANTAENTSHNFITVIGDNIEIGSDDSIPKIFGNITLTTKKNDCQKIYRSGKNESWWNTGMFTVGANGNLTFRDNDTGILTLDGMSISTDNKQPLVYVESGTLTLLGGNITNNTAYYGGGIHVESGTFILSKGNITRNSANYGGGISLEYSTFTMSDGNITDNMVTKSGGGVNMESSTLTMSGGSISNNKEYMYNDWGVLGVGVYIYRGEFTMDGGNINQNIAYNSGSGGGGVYVNNATFTMNSGMINENKADFGIGVMIGDHGNFTMNDGTISNNRQIISGKGGGVYIDENCEFKMNGGHIKNNNVQGNGGMSPDEGGGVYVEGTFTLNAGGIANNTATNGGGVYNSGKFTMNNGDIDNNTASMGGGVCLDNYAEFTMSDGNIANNKAAAGAGVCATMNMCKFTMNNGNIIGNVARGTGGGVLIQYNHATFIMSGGNISDNIAETGGGVYVEDGGNCTMSGGNITGNTAAQNGAELWLDSDEFVMSNNAFIGPNSTYFDDLYSLITVAGDLANGGGVKNITGYAFHEGYEVVNFTNSLSARAYQNNFTLSPTVTFLLSPTLNDKTLVLITNADQLILNLDQTEIQLGSEVLFTVIAVDSSTTTAYDDLEFTTTVLHVESGSREYIPLGYTGTSNTWGYTPLQKGTYKFTAKTIVTGIDSNEETLVVIASDPSLPIPSPIPSTTGLIPSSDGNMNNAFRVLFDTNGGSFISPITDLSYGDTFGQPPVPTKDGYTFNGWYTDTACRNPWTFSSGVNGDMTLYAKWTANTTKEQTEPNPAQDTQRPSTETASVQQATVSQSSSTTTQPAKTTATIQPTLTEAPAPVAGILFGLLGAGALIRRRR